MSNQGLDQDQDPSEAFSDLGVEPNSSFEKIQEARNKKLLEAGEDVLLKAKIESSYDSLLMNSLKERRQGKISNEAVSASNKEKNERGLLQDGLNIKLLNRVNPFGSGNEVNGKQNVLFATDFPKGDDFLLRLFFGLLFIVLLLVSPDQSIQLILSLATILLFISQLKRGRRVLQSLGWSVVFLSFGYILGGLIVGGIDNSNSQSVLISINKLESLPVLIMLWIGSFF